MISSPLNAEVTKSARHGANCPQVCYKRLKLRKSILIPETKCQDTPR
jgi:hypothetical protein